MADSKRFLLRLDPRLFEALRRWARDDLRSINAQIEYLLTEQARRAGRLSQQAGEPTLREATTPASGNRAPDPGAPLTSAGAPEHETSER